MTELVEQYLAEVFPKSKNFKKLTTVLAPSLHRRENPFKAEIENRDFSFLKNYLIFHNEKFVGLNTDFILARGLQPHSELDKPILFSCGNYSGVSTFVRILRDCLQQNNIKCEYIPDNLCSGNILGRDENSFWNSLNLDFYSNKDVVLINVSNVKNKNLLTFISVLLLQKITVIMLVPAIEIRYKSSIKTVLPHIKFESQFQIGAKVPATREEQIKKKIFPRDEQKMDAIAPELAQQLGKYLNLN